MNPKNLPKRKEIKNKAITQWTASLPEGELKDMLFRARLRPIQQYIIGAYVVDFALPDLRLVIEYDGKIHLERLENDRKRDDYLSGKGWNILHLAHKEIGYSITFNNEFVGFTADQEIAMEIIVKKTLEFKREEERKRPDYLLNISLQKDDSKFEELTPIKSIIKLC